MPSTNYRLMPGSLKEFYSLMEKTRDIRRQAVQELWAGRTDQASNSRWAAALQVVRDSLDNLPWADPADPRRRRIPIGPEKSIDLDLRYEFQELEKDVIFLRQGEEALLNHLAGLHSGFEEQVRRGLDLLRGLFFNAFITDRDGTVNNYCGRYRSSIQSIYNAVFLARFARRLTRKPVLLTSSPLKDGGLLDVSVLPGGTFILAGSKGREFLDLQGRLYREPLEPRQEELLAGLNRRLAELVSRPEYEIFGLVGSGLQFKFGQTTVARQDISRSIPEEQSRAFLEKVSGLARELDPEGDVFRLEDTGLDIEIIVTIHDPEAGLKDFDKGDAVRYLERTLALGLKHGSNLVCGDTASDLPMLRAAADFNEDTWSVFVTGKEELAAKVLDICPRAFIASEPDVLVSILGSLPSRTKMETHP